LVIPACYDRAREKLGTTSRAQGSIPLERKRFIMNAGRTTKQGQQINIGKDSAEYQSTVSTVTMHPDDMKEAGIQPGGRVRIRSDYGEVTFRCVEGKVPAGMIFVPYGPPTCHLMGQSTDGTGMPTSKGWEVDIEPIA
jgi:formylmethanofuran dehydrogenase subunit D